MFLDKPPRIVAFQLGRLTNAQLLLVERKTDHPRYRPVFEAILARKDLDRKQRVEAARALAALNQSDVVAEFVAAVERLDAMETPDAGVLRDLARLLAAGEAPLLAAQRKRIETLAAAGQNGFVRRVAFSGLVHADRGVDAAWKLAAVSGDRLVDLVSAVDLVQDPALRASFAPRVAPLLSGESTPALRRAAIEAQSSMPGRAKENFAAFAALVEKGIERETAVRALRRVPRAEWPRGDTLHGLVNAVVAWVAGTPASERTAPAILEAVELGQELSQQIAPEKGLEVRRVLSSLGVRVVLLKTVRDQMVYDKRFFAVEAGKPVEVVLENLDFMPHNFVVGAVGSLPDLGALADAMPPTPESAARHYVPESPKVLHMMPLVPPGGREKLSFRAPTEPGDYPYVCTFPGHWRRMYGVLVVVKDLDAWLTDPKEPPDPLGNTRKLIKEWTLEDFAGDAGAAPPHRHFESAKTLFTEAGCVTCHVVRGEGGKVGPDLTEVFAKWKGVRADLLREILDPSLTVDEKFQTHLVQTRDGRSLIGVVVAEDASSISMVSNPVLPVVEKIPKSAIASQLKTEGSLMPQGLLNNFAKAEILELLGYLEAGGDPKSAVFHSAH